MQSHVFACAFGVAVACAQFASAADKLRVAIGNAGVGESSTTDLGKAAGFFARRGLDIETTYTQGSAETIQVLLSGGADISVAVGTLGALAVYGKGAPIRVTGASFTGDSNMFLWVPANSPIRRVEETGGKTVAYSNAGSSSQMMVLEARKQFNVDMKPTATGGGPATITQVMSGQVDVGWSGAPFGVDLLETGKIRMIMKASDLTAMAGQSSRVIVASLEDLGKRPDAHRRFMQAYRDTVDWLYTTPEGLKAYAEFMKLPEPIARRTLDEFLPRAALDVDRLAGLEQNMRLAVEQKYLAAPLTQQQLAEFVKIPAPIR